MPERSLSSWVSFPGGHQRSPTFHRPSWPWWTEGQGRPSGTPGGSDPTDCCLAIEGSVPVTYGTSLANPSHSARVASYGIRNTRESRDPPRRHDPRRRRPLREPAPHHARTDAGRGELGTGHRPIRCGPSASPGQLPRPRSPGLPRRGERPRPGCPREDDPVLRLVLEPDARLSEQVLG